MFLKPLLHAFIDPVANFPKLLEFLLFTTWAGGGIFKGPGQFVDGPEKSYGAVFFGAVTQEKDVTGGDSAQEVFDLGGMAVTQVDAGFGQDMPGVGMYL